LPWIDNHVDSALNWQQDCPQRQVLNQKEQKRPIVASQSDFSRLSKVPEYHTSGSPALNLVHHWCLTRIGRTAVDEAIDAMYTVSSVAIDANKNPLFARRFFVLLSSEGVVF
jgi:hypothetical protein